MSVSNPAPPRRRLSKEARREKLLAAARDVFGEVGYQDATMEAIAVRTGVTRSLLYEHFGSLDEIYVECVRAARAKLDGLFVDVSVVHQGHPRDQLRAGITAYFRFVAEQGRSWDVLSGTGVVPAGPIGEIASELRFRTADQIAALFSLAIPEVDPAEVNAYAHVISGGGEQLARWWRHHPDVPLDTVVDRFMAVAWDGLQQFVP